MKKLLKHIAHRLGYDILHLPTDLTTRQWLDLLNSNQINQIFDIGANIGQYGRKIRSLGYMGEIVSFEPINEVYEQLKNSVSIDPSWIVVQSAIGHYDGTAEINVASNSYSSSIRNMLPLHIESAPDAVYSHKETIRIQKIDTIIDQYYSLGKNLYLKIDAQGFERQIFEGCLQSLPKIRGFQLELSLFPLYEGETLMQEMVNLLRKHDFKLKLIESGHRNYNTGELLQIEGYFFR